MKIAGWEAPWWAWIILAAWGIGISYMAILIVLALERAAGL